MGATFLQNNSRETSDIFFFQETHNWKKKMILRLFAHGTPLFWKQRDEIGALINQCFHSNNETPICHWWITCRKNNRLVGVASCVLDRDEKRGPHRSKIYLCNLCVHPNYTRQGIATAILKKSHEYFSGWIYGELFWKVEQSNHAAIALYDKYGMAFKHFNSSGDIITYHINLHARL